ncbi:MAG: hypothetical protein RBR22_09860 [Desulfuromonas sp.]|nr:hypothetical protein [Desulfuromonas sp.]
MIPKYTGEWDRGSVWRGDTLLGFSMRIFDKDTLLAVVPISVCAHIVDSFGRKVVALESSIGVDGTVTFDRIDGRVTATWRAGAYAFDVEYTLADGRIRTYLVSSFEVLEDKSKCR